MPAIKKVYETIEIRKINKSLYLLDSEREIFIKKVIKRFFKFR